MYREETDYGYRREQRYEDDYGRRPGRRYEYEQDYDRNQWNRPGSDRPQFRDRGGMNYGNDWGYSRNQERYDERNQQGRGYPHEGAPDHQQQQRRSNYGGDWYSGGYGGRTSRRSSWGEPYGQDYYTENAWNRQRSQPWTRTDDQMEKNDDYRQARGPAGRMYNRPTGKNDEGLRKLLTDQLKDMYWAEKELTKELPKLIDKASSPQLKNALEDHLFETKEQVSRLEEIFSRIGEKASANKCDAMKGLMKEAHDITKEMEEGSVRDAGIICAAQKTEHYEIATYGCLSTYAEILGEIEVVNLLEDILHEEKRADKTLTQVARSINWQAAEQGIEEEEEEEEEDEEEEYEEDDETGNEEEEDEENDYPGIKGTSGISGFKTTES